MKEKNKALEEKEQKIGELTDMLQRLQAEFENYKKRQEKQNSQLCDFSQAELMCQILPILDSFELAFKSQSKPEEFIKGMELVYAQFRALLEKQGLKKIECDHKKFDPYFHEVLLTEPSNKEEETILEELQSGYCFKDRVIRHSKVKIAKKNEPTKTDSTKKKDIPEC